MVSADMLDAIDRILRRVKRKQFVAFGGVQVVMIGDVFQLPPVVTEEDKELKNYMDQTYRSPNFYDARVWVDTTLEVYELTEVFRQREREFKKVLNNIRIGTHTQEDLDFINNAARREVPESLKDDIVTAVTTNPRAQQINDEEMARLGDVKSKTYLGEFSGLGRESFGRNLPAPQKLFLKVGTKVMFTMNDIPKSPKKDSLDVESGQGEETKRRWVNGTMGVVVDVLEKVVKVKVGDEIYDVTPASWDRVGYNVIQTADAISNQVQNKLKPFTEASYKQYPLAPAWAITIHKMQGKTIENLKLDLDKKPFAPGQLYTGLSRVKSLSGLYLSRPIGLGDIKVSEDAIRFTSQTTGLDDKEDSGLSLMEFGGEPFDPADPNLDLDKERGYDFTSGPYGIPLLDYQEDELKSYADMIAEAEKQFGSNSNKVKNLKSVRRQHYDSWFSVPRLREDNIMEKAIENLDIDFDGATTTERETPTVVESTTKITASYKDRYGRPYKLSAKVSLKENDYDPEQLDTYISIDAFDPANPSAGAVATFGTKVGSPMADKLANEVYIDGIYTNEPYQRRHLATGLLAFASKLTDKKIRHSDKLTKMGYSFMESVELDDRLKTINYPSLAESQADAEGALSIDMTKLKRTKSSAEITDLLQRLNADQIPYKLTY
jgi:hypothetical protein